MNGYEFTLFPLKFARWDENGARAISIVTIIIIVLYYNAAALQCKYMKHVDPQIRVTDTKFKSLNIFFRNF